MSDPCAGVGQMALSAGGLQSFFGDGELLAGVVDEIGQRPARSGSPSVTEKLAGKVVVAEDARIMRIGLDEGRTRGLIEVLIDEACISGNCKVTLMVKQGLTSVPGRLFVRFGCRARNVVSCEDGCGRCFQNAQRG